MSSRGPALFPEATNAGIILDPRTLERVIPATKRADGSVRKEIKIRPGFTPVEDVSAFRSRRQQQTPPPSKGSSVPGWTPPTQSTSRPAAAAATAAKPVAAPAANSEPLTKAASKNAKRAEKRKEKRVAEQADFIRQRYGGDDDDDVPSSQSKQSADASVDQLADKLKESTVS